MTNLGEQQLDEVKHAATTALICIYLLLVGLAGFLHKVPTVLGECACAIVHVLLFLPFSQPIFFLLFSPRKEPFSDKYLLLGRIIGLIKQVTSLIMFFAGGYFGWLISSQLDDLGKKLSALDKTYADKGISLDEKNAAVKQAVSDMQSFISDQANLIFSFISIIIAAWLCLLAVDLMRGYIDGDLMSTFRGFDSLSANESLAPENCEYGGCVRLIPSRAYFWYRKIAERIAEMSFVWFLFYLLCFFLLAYSKFDGALQELHVQFDEWFSAQMNRLCGLALS